MKTFFTLMISLSFFSGLVKAEGLVALPMTAQTFQATLDYMNAMINPIIRAQYQKPFLANGDWNRPRTPTSPGGSFYVPIVGGEVVLGVYLAGWLAQKPGINTDGMEFILCHELGHHIVGGGNEVGADNFAPTCLQWLWPKSQNDEWLQGLKTPIDPSVEKQCETETSDKILCLRIFSAYLVLENFRVKSWKGIIPAKDMDTAKACRRQSIELGISSQKPPVCKY